ncbi:MAG: DegV family EDD domain-containing protein [Lachnospiraceae bacterium]|nr:DegV family EDD domain-containing protein [Lachnospiraceae bacterium]
MTDLMRRIKRFLRSLMDPDRDFSERRYVLMTTISIIAVFLVLIGDIIIGENLPEILALAGIIIIGPIVTLISVRKHRLHVGSVINAIGIVCIVIPVSFFSGGGLTGGTAVWIAFAFLYIGIVMEGKARTLFLCLMTVTAAGEFAVAYFYPDLVTVHDRNMWFLDTVISALLVGFLIFIMVWFQNSMFIAENEKAVKQAKEIEELNRSQNRFFSSMSHEIRTPINTIIGLNEMILRENASDEINEDAVNIQSAGKMLLSLINDILDMSRFESGQMELKCGNYNTGDMLSDVVNMLWLRAKEKGLDFTIDVSPELPQELYGDEVRIKQILINVLNNAIKYTSEGSVKLQIQCEKLEGDRVNVVYIVSDTGMGIKKESLPYLFTAFKRVDEDKNRHIEGTGLGLSIVKVLVEMMGGKVTVNSIYKKGSTFMIEIPQPVVVSEGIGEIDMASHRKSRLLNSHTASFEAPGARVLVVDDTASNLMVVEKLLRQTKIVVDTAASGKEALQKTLDESYNVILMDHMMPGMDGIECMHRIRNQTGGLSRESVIVALTANAGSDVETMYEKEGFDGYLLKPISGEALERELYRLLPKDLVIVTGSSENLEKESVSWIREHKKKAPVLITADSLADIPGSLVKELGIVTMPHMVKTGEGLFRDGLEIGTRGLLTYMERNNEEVVYTLPPSVKDCEEFFSSMLELANNVIHISISSKMDHSGYHPTKEAAGNFDNVFVFDSGHLSSGQGLIAIEAARLAAKGMEPAKIIERLERMKEHVYTSFIVDTLDFLVRQSQVGARIANITKALLIHPVLALKHGKMSVSKVFFGARERTWNMYVSSVFRVPGRIDRRMLFVTYVGMDQRELKRVEEMIRKRIDFDKIYFQCASPAIAVNCGPGTFGCLFFTEY